jgi:dephospho-CoA kinase
MKVIGLAGETGCGKSTAARELAKEKGIVWVDLDRLSWEIYRPRTPTYRRLVSRYGERILDSDTKTLLVEGALLASSAHVDRTLFDAILWLEVAAEKRRERLQTDGREEQIERTLPPPADEQVVKIDASGTIEQTVNRIGNIVNSL